MSIETMKLCPGDKVRITKTAFELSVDVVDIVEATKPHNPLVSEKINSA
jgi:hypothetical protein